MLRRPRRRRRLPRRDSCSRPRRPRFAGVDQVELRLPLKPRLPLRGNETHRARAVHRRHRRREGEATSGSRTSTCRASSTGSSRSSSRRRRSSRSSTLPADLKLPTQNLTDLAKDREFWRPLGRPDRRRRSSSPAASSSRSRIAPGTRRRSTSRRSTGGPTTGRSTSSRPDSCSTSCSSSSTAAPARSCSRTSSRTSARPASRRADELQGLFENLFSLENQILNTFVARDREAERYIFTQLTRPDPNP